MSAAFCMTDKAGKVDYLHLAFAAIIGLFVAAYAEMFHEAIYLAGTGEYTGLLANHLSASVVWHVLAAFALVFCLCYLLVGPYRRALSFVYRHRFAIAVGIIAFCTLFCISGSSVALYANVLPGDGSSGLLFGIPRFSRSDEWAVTMPLIFSQESVGYSSVSDILRAAATNVTLGYNLPSWSLVTLFEPLTWGFLLLGSIRGLAFFWSLRVVGCFIVSFECAMIYTRRNKWVSALAAVLVTFSPMSMWWGGDLGYFIIGQGLVIALYYYLRQGTMWKKTLIAVVLFWLAGCYLFFMYPAWQVPLFYVFACMGAWVIYDYVKSGRAEGTGSAFRPLRDIPVLVVLAALLVAAIVYVFWYGADVLATMGATAYPGQRFETGGHGAATLFQYGGSLFYAIDDARILPNPCEMSAYFTLFPLGIISGVITFFRRRRSLLLGLLIIVEVCFIFYTCVPIPDFLARITLMSNVPTGRLAIGTGYIEIVLLSLALSSVETNPIRSASGQGGTLACALGPFGQRMLAVVSVVTAAVLTALCTLVERDFMRVVYMCLLLIILALMVYCVLAYYLRGERRALRMLFVSVACVVGISGLAVNPVQLGAPLLKDSNLTKAVQSVDANDGDFTGTWLSVDTGMPISNLCVSAGASIINCTNSYPLVDRWKAIDKGADDSEVYNRYAHITVQLKTGDTEFHLVSADSIEIDVSYGDLKKLDVNYIISPDQLADADGVKFNVIDSADGYYIYQVAYTDQAA